MKTLRLGIIGAGSFVVKRHIPEILKIKNQVKLVSICRRNKKKLNIISNLFKIDSFYSNHIEMLKNENLDLVLIASPHSLHYKHALDSLKFNCHVVIEKPMTTTLEESKKLIQFAKKKNKKIIPLLNPPFENHLYKLKKIILNKSKFGNLEHANLTWLDYKSPFFGKGIFTSSQISKIMPTNFRLNKRLSSGGILFDSGCHLIAEVIWILNKKPNSIYASMNDLNSELRLTITMIFKNSLFINLNIIGDSQFKNRRVESCYWGSKQVARMTGKPFRIDISGSNSDKIKTVKNFNNVNTPIKEAMNHINKNKKLEVTLDQSKTIISIIQSAYKSAKTGKKELIRY